MSTIAKHPCDEILPGAPALPSMPEEEWPEQDAPFVSVPPLARSLVLLVMAAYTLAMTAIPLFRAWESGLSFVAIGVSNFFCLTAISLPVLFWRKEYGWVHPLVFTALFTLFGTVMRKTSLFTFGMPEHIMLPLMNAEALNYLFAYGNFVEGCAALAIFVGFHCGPKWAGFTLRSTEPRNTWFGLVIAAAILISLVAFYFYMRIFGDFNTLLLNLSRGSGQKLGSNGEMAYGQYIAFIKIGAVAGLLVLARQASALQNPLLWLVCAYGAIIGYMVDGKRSALINCAIIYAVAWILRNRRVPYFRVAILGTVCFLLLGLLGLYRWSNWSRTDQASLDFLSDASARSVASTTFDELAARTGSESTFYPILAKVPGETSMLWGRSYLGWGIMFIPRVCWPDKPRGVDVQAGLEFNDAEWGMPAGAVGEAYWNFLLPGVLGVFFLYGSFLRWLGAIILKNPGSTVAIAFYAIGLFYFEPSQNGFRAMVYALVPATLLFALAGYFRQPRPLPR